MIFYTVFGIWDGVSCTWDGVFCIWNGVSYIWDSAADILNEGEKKANGRVARFAVSLKTDPSASARLQHCTWEDCGLIGLVKIAIAYNP